MVCSQRSQFLQHLASHSHGGVVPAPSYSVAASLALVWTAHKRSAQQHLVLKAEDATPGRFLVGLLEHSAAARFISQVTGTRMHAGPGDAA